MPDLQRYPIYFRPDKQMIKKSVKMTDVFYLYARKKDNIFNNYFQRFRWLELGI